MPGIHILIMAVDMPAPTTALTNADDGHSFSFK